VGAALEIPVPETSDGEDVRSALETADALWSAGNHGEAVRLLRIAAEKASDAGNDLRALEIARAVADISAREAVRAALAEPMEETDEQTDRQTVVQPMSQRPAPDRAPAVDHTPAVDQTPRANETSGTMRAVASVQRQAVRVSVRPGLGPSGALQVRLLAEHESPDDGSFEAILVAVEAGAELLRPRR
jgi:hypothetical protein